MDLASRLAAEKLEVREILKTYEGRKLIWRILEQCGVYRVSFTGDALETAFREGQRSTGLWILTEIVFTNGPDTFSIMSREAEDRRERQEKEVLNVGNDD